MLGSSWDKDWIGILVNSRITLRQVCSDQFKRADQDCDGTLSFPQVSALCSEVCNNACVASPGNDRLRKLFESADRSNKNVLIEEEFVDFFAQFLVACLKQLDLNSQTSSGRSPDARQNAFLDSPMFNKSPMSTPSTSDSASPVKVAGAHQLARQPMAGPVLTPRGVARQQAQSENVAESRQVSMSVGSGLLTMSPLSGPVLTPRGAAQRNVQAALQNVDSSRACWTEQFMEAGSPPTQPMAGRSLTPRDAARQQVQSQNAAEIDSGSKGSQVSKSFAPGLQTMSLSEPLRSPRGVARRSLTPEGSAQRRVRVLDEQQTRDCGTDGPTPRSKDAKRRVQEQDAPQIERSRSNGQAPRSADACSPAARATARLPDLRIPSTFDSMPRSEPAQGEPKANTALKRFTLVVKNIIHNRRSRAEHFRDALAVIDHARSLRAATLRLDMRHGGACGKFRSAVGWVAFLGGPKGFGQPKLCTDDIRSVLLKFGWHEDALLKKWRFREPPDLELLERAFRARADVHVEAPRPRPAPLDEAEGWQNWTEDDDEEEEHRETEVAS